MTAIATCSVPSDRWKGCHNMGEHMNVETVFLSIFKKSVNVL
jgi:hypothetical protein